MMHKWGNWGLGIGIDCSLCFVFLWSGFVFIGMTTIVTHIALPVLSRFVLGRKVISNRLLWAGIFASILPDLDVVLFKFGVAYANQFGHRGASHSFLLVLVVAVLAGCCAPWLKSGRLKAFLFVGVSMLSHSVLDALTNGGLGVAWFWPWDQTRYFFPYAPIEVSPLGIRAFVSAWGGKVLLSELLWVWLPLTVLALVVKMGLRQSKVKWNHG